MHAPLVIEGTYTVDGSKLVSTDKQYYFLLQERKLIVGNKPKKFIIAKCQKCSFSDTGKPDQYVSSVFDNGRIEYQGVWYRISFADGTAVITRSK